MRKTAGLITVMAGILLGYVAAILLRPPSVEARTWPSGCNVPKAVGTLKTARADGWLFFEDGAGVVRGVDTECKVKITISRD